MNRITRLAHPPVLTRGTKPLLYGRGIPAPWNSHAIPPTESNGVPGTPLAAKHKDKEKDKDGENGDVPSKPFLPDAQLLATWDFDTKDYKVPLPSSSSLPILSSHPLRHHRSRVGSVHGSGIAGSSSGGVISLAATRSRSGSKLG
jgi:Wiskott-Aldrich syndrome protein